MNSVRLHPTAFMLLAALALSIAFAPASSSQAQEGSLLEELNGLAAGLPPSNASGPVTLEAMFVMKSKASREGTLIVRADIEDNWHLYSVTQPKGGPLRSRINVNDSNVFKVKGEFKSYNSPHVEKNHLDYDVNVEDHSGRATWSVPIELAKGVDAKSVKIQVVFNGQACASTPDGKTGQCVLVEADDLVAQFSGVQPTTGEFQAESSHVKLKGRVYNAANPKMAIKAGDKVKLEITAHPTEGYHLYGYAPSIPKDAIVNPTLLAITKGNGWKFSDPKANLKLDITQPADKQYYSKPVTWTYDIEIPKSVETGNVSIAGMIGYQACTDRNCDFPTSVEFMVDVPVGDAKKTGPAEMAFQASEESYRSISESNKRMMKK